MLEPGAKKIKLYAGKGRLTSKLIHATQYTQDRAALQSWCQELNATNPGFVFEVKEITDDRNMYRNATESETPCPP